jgi:hypothetical protein
MTEINIDHIKVIDNYFPKYFQELIHDDLLDMEWGFKNSPYANFHNSRMFGITLFFNGYYHTKCPDSIRKFTEDVYNDILCEYSNMTLVRILANMQGLHQYAEIHTDSSTNNYLSLVYHVNESDGDTVFYNSDGSVVHSVPFKMGRMIIFPSDYLHEGLPPVKYINPTNNFRMSLGYCFHHD